MWRRDDPGARGNGRVVSRRVPTRTHESCRWVFAEVGLIVRSKVLPDLVFFACLILEYFSNKPSLSSIEYDMLALLCKCVIEF